MFGENYRGAYVLRPRSLRRSHTHTAAFQIQKFEKSPVRLDDSYLCRIRISCTGRAADGALVFRWLFQYRECWKILTFRTCLVMPRLGKRLQDDWKSHPEIQFPDQPGVKCDRYRVR